MEHNASQARGQWALAWRRLKRDRFALACGVFLVALVFAVGPGAPLYERIVGHGPNDPFPYAVSVQLRPVGPFSTTWDTPRLVDTDPFAFKYLRIVRARMVEVLDEPWVRTARAKGASELRVIRAHALRNAVAPVVTMLAMDGGMAIGIAMYVETVFGLPGLGRTLIRAEAGLQGYDLPVILAVTLVAGAAIILFNLIADLVVLALDPTLARSSRRGLLRLAGRTA
jgi:hypothetical protein